ncbi:MurT ligase domain-containing protein [Pengzhenrongella sp.]|jgi:UDP-N-acetylmuramyl tripeptide synthase|uniref:MurT ligase domain-containing protein n=1 Tax=Pengzhenrongella sp. TaxID=2888820 RepID=UPI002F91D137
MRGGGTALPGLVVERLDPLFLARVLGDLPEGVIVITGTNGKTTTTKIVVELLRASGLRVVTNKTGSNFTRGIIAGLLGDLDQHGRLDADIAVLELDEAHAMHFIEHIAPRYSLLLNVMRDQLDRYGEIDHTAELLERVALATSDGVVLNRDDALVRSIADKLSPAVNLRYFGFRKSMKKSFLSDHDLYGTSDVAPGSVPGVHGTDVILAGLEEKTATFAYGDEAQEPVTLRIDGIHNVLNATAALSLVRMVLGPRADEALLMRTLSTVGPAFGRGESIDVNGYPLEIVLVKNPAGFRLALNSYAGDDAVTMIAINDSYVDGRDVSWLWDVDFESLWDVSVVSGVRAYDMAVRLQYDNIEVARVEPSLPKALEGLLRESGPRRIFCTYTAMMTLRGILQSRFGLASIE